MKVLNSYYRNIFLCFNSLPGALLLLLGGLLFYLFFNIFCEEDEDEVQEEKQLFLLWYCATSLRNIIKRDRRIKRTTVERATHKVELIL